MDGKQWRKEEVDFLLSNYEKLSFKHLSENLNRSIESIRSKLKRMGIQKEKSKKIENRSHLINKPPIGKANKIPDQRTKRRPKEYASLKRDFSKMVQVFIDKKTMIYIKDGEDPAEARKKYFERLEQRPPSF